MAIAPLLFVLTLLFSQLIYTHSSENQSLLYGHLKSKCPNITKNRMVEECSSTKVAEVFNSSDSNVDNVLCTVHLYNMWKFINNSLHKCDELFSKQENYNSTICEKPNFLIINEKDKLNQIDLVKFLCEKLCINWDQTINLHCSSAKYYYDQLEKLHKPSITQHYINNSLLNDQLNNRGNDTNGNEARASVKPNITTVQKSERKSEKNETISEMVKSNGNSSNHTSYNVSDEKKQEKVKEDSSKSKKENIINNNLDVSDNKLNTQLLPNVTKDKKGSEIKKDELLPKVTKDKKVSESKKDVSNKIDSTTKLPDKNIDESYAFKKDQFVENEVDEVPYTQEGDEESADNEQELNGNVVSRMEKPNTLVEDNPVSNVNTEVDGESYFFSYFMVVCILFVMGYVFYHNRAKVMAMVVEGKRNKRQFRDRRPNSANYHKLDSNLEEALTSTCNKNSNQIIY